MVRTSLPPTRGVRRGRGAAGGGKDRKGKQDRDGAPASSCSSLPCCCGCARLPEEWEEWCRKHIAERWEVPRRHHLWQAAEALLRTSFIRAPTPGHSEVVPPRTGFELIAERVHYKMATVPFTLFSRLIFQRALQMVVKQHIHLFFSGHKRHHKW